MERYDVAIIGSGPAGMEAALTLKNRNKSFILFGSNNLSDKVYKAHEVKNYLGLPNIKGEDFYKAFKNHLDLMDIKVTEDHIKQIFDMGDFYALQGERSTEMYEAKTIIIATGVKMDKTIKGEDELLGRGISYCATCDAPLYRKKNIAVLLESMDEFSEVEFLSTLVNHIDLFPLFKGDIKALPNMDIRDSKILEFQGTRKLEKIITSDVEYEVDGMFILRKSVPMSYLINGIEMDGAHIKVNRALETNLRGVYAAGDITGLPYQYIKAAGEGNVAALSVVSYLAKNK